jgi:hypothetical protein
MASPGAGDVVVKGTGWTYVGQILAGTETRHGRGVCTYTSGSRYEGEWRDGKAHGRGVFWFADGRVFDGAWAGGCPLRGTAMAADRALSLAVFDGKTPISDG